MKCFFMGAVMSGVLVIMFCATKVVVRLDAIIKLLEAVK